MECHLSRTRVHIDGVSLFGLKAAARGAAGVPGVGLGWRWPPNRAAQTLRPVNHS